ncbi:fused MFS/spermidine synthase [Yoonia sp. 208BN28-4]|uniref:fused MFS/spermidine synthase n=1 Tax=Yoonia sp. 208BN28-4 TaxID=3126505 RepID=UPI00309F4D66
MQFWRAIILILVLSVVGLTYEIAAGRVLAPFFGTSLITWTAVIATVLAGFSLGSALGGLIAEREPSVATRAVRQALIATGILMALSPTILGILYTAGARGTGGMFFSVVIAFFPASVLVSFPSPYLAKLAVQARPGREGSSLGLVLAAGSVGAIFGAILAGFVALPFAGSSLTFLMCGVAAFLCVPWIKNTAPVEPSTLVLGLFAIGLNLLNGSVCRYESGLSCIDVGRRGSEIALFSDRVRQAAERNTIGTASAPEDVLVLPYTQLIWSQLAQDLPTDAEVLFIGGGGYSLPSLLVSASPTVQADVVEIDPMITEVVKQNLPWAGTVIRENERLEIVHADGRMFINETPKQYDAAVMDAFSSNSVPAHLVTLETYQQLRNVVAGPVYVNLIDEPDGRLVQGTYAILNQVYPHVTAVTGTLSPRGYANIVLTASPSPLEPLDEMPDGYAVSSISDSRAFTDDRGWIGHR